MISRWARQWAPKVMQPIVHRLARLGVTPNGLTIAGLILTILSGLSIAADRLLLGAVFLLFSGLCDSLDGEMARQQNPSSRLGPFIDSIADHYGDLVVYMGLAWRGLNGGDRLTVLLVLVAMFGSLAGSQVRSRAGMIGVDTRTVGIFTRMERTLVLLLGLLSGLVPITLGLLALATNFSALQRIVYVLKTGEPSAELSKPSDEVTPKPIR